MKLYASLLFCFVVALNFAQNNYIVKTEDGRRVLLKADYTWEYIDVLPLTLVDSTKLKPIKPLSPNACNVINGFEEPALNQKVQSQLKKGRATMAHIKDRVAKDHNCNVEDVTLLSVSESKVSGNYTFCANGKKVFYKRNGHKILEKGKLF